MAEPGFECPDCGIKLSSTTRCASCGWKRGASTEPKKKTDHAQCSYLSSGSWRCPLAASWFPNGGEHSGSCSWHAEVIKNPRLDTFEEFERWCGWIHSANYCTIWSHCRPSELYDHLAGRKVGEPIKHPCALPGCPYRPTDESPEAVAKFREQVRLGGGITAKF